MRKLLSMRLLMIVLILFVPPACGGNVDEMGTLPPGGAIPGGTPTPPLGSTWTTQASPTTNDLLAVATSGAIFVACGSGTLTRSTNGVNWAAAATAPPGAGCTDVTWTGARFVAVGGIGGVLLSVDGDTWTAATTVPPLTTALNGVGSNGGSTVVAVAGVNAGTSLTEIIVSADGGNNWSAATFVPAGSDVLFGVTWSSSPARFVAVGANGNILTSTDGSTWSTSRSSIAGQSWLVEAVWDGATYVAVGGTSGAVTYSTDTTTWTTSNTALTATTAEAIDWSNSQFLVVGYTSLGAGSYDSRVCISSDGISWSSGTISGLGVQLFDVVGVTGMYVAVGAGGTIITSP